MLAKITEQPNIIAEHIPPHRTPYILTSFLHVMLWSRTVFRIEGQFFVVKLQMMWPSSVGLNGVSR
jgi:hypothetical protein